MAKGKKDVELTIRAKNEASKAIDSVAAALKQLKDAQKDVSKESQKTGSVISRLGDSLTQLNKQVGGTASFDAITASVGKAGRAVARLDQDVANLTTEQARLAAETVKTEAALNAYNATAGKLTGTLKSQQTAAKGTADELKQLDSAVKQGGQALGKAATETRKYETALQRAETGLAKTQAKHRELAQAILQTAEPQKKLIAQFERTDSTLRKQTDTVARLKTDYAQSRLAVASLGSTLDSLKTKQASYAQATQVLGDAQRKTAAELKYAELQVREASTALTKLQGSASSTADALARQDEALKNARVNLAAIEAMATKADIAMSKIGGTIRQQLLRALADSKGSLVDYRTEWERTTAAVKAMMAGGASAKNPTPELTAAITQARQAKQAYLEMQVAVQKMRTAVRDAGGDVQKLSAAQVTFAAALDRVKTRATQTGTAVKQIAGAMNETNVATNKVDQSTRKTANAMDLLAGRSRKAMSVTQRLRGELLSLATSYVGVFAGIQQLSGVTKTFMDIEAAQTRMGVAFQGNMAVVGQEMRFVRGEANRLKIDFRLLAAEYSKLAIATQGSKLEGQETRDIFVALSESFRVSKLSAEQMEGAFLAVTQMVNKGAVSMEELRRQLGERLYGAFRLAAQSMGLTGKELDKLVSTGKLATDDFLPAFAREVRKTFSPQLSQALQTYTSDLGDFQNAIVEAQERVAKGGFMAGMSDALRSLTASMRSAQGAAFFDNLGKAAGGLVRVLAVIPQHMDKIVFAFTLLLGMKAASWAGDLSGKLSSVLAVMKPLPPVVQSSAFAVTGLATATRTAVPLMTRLSQSVQAVGPAMRTAAQGMTVARAGTIALTGSLNVLRGAFALIGGIPGLIVTGIATAMSLWVGKTDDVVTATAEHERQMNIIIDQYSRAADKAGDWAKGINNVSLAGAEKTLQDLATAADKALGNVSSKVTDRMRMTLGEGMTDSFGGPVSAPLSGFEKVVVDLGKQLKAGKITVDTYSQALDAILRSPAAPERLKDLIRTNGDLIQKAKEAELNLAKQGLVVQALGGNVASVTPLIDALGLSMKGLAEDAGLAGENLGKALTDPTAELNAKLEELKSMVPSLADELKLLEGVKAIDDVLKTTDLIEGLDKSSTAYKNLLEIARQAKQELQLGFDEKKFSGLRQMMAGSDTGSSVDASAKLLRKFEGFIASPKWDVNAMRVGFGSDTITLADGSVQKVVEGMKVSVADANRDLIRRIGEFQSKVREQAGSARFESFSTQQQAALTSVAYNYGSLPKRILEAVRTGTNEEIAQAIKGLGGDNEGINRDRRNQEAFLFQSGADPDAQFKKTEQALDKQVKLEQQKAEKAAAYHTKLAESLDLKRQESETDKKMTQEQTVQLELSKAEIEARRAGTELTAQEKEQITQITAAQWQRLNATREQEEAEKRINTLTQTRRDLIQQMDHALQGGDLQQYTALREQLTLLDEQLRSVVEATIAMWQASGESEKSAAAIANLRVLLGTLQAVRDKTKLLASDFGEAFGKQLMSAADGFLDKIRETGDVLGSAKIAVQQFASDFLLQMAKMIMQQMIFNAISSIGGGYGSFVSGAISGVSRNHTGGVIGHGSPLMRTGAGMFANAVRYHTGGVAGLAPNEVPAVLEKGEEVLTANDPRHVNNGGGQQEMSVKVVNAIDAGSFMSAGMEDVQGQKAILNFVRANSGAVRGALGV